MGLALKSMKYTKENVLLYALSGLLWGLLGLSLGKTEGDIAARAGVVFVLVIPWMFFALTGTLPLVAMGMPLLRKELYSGAYRVGSFYCSRALTLHPFFLAESAGLSLIVYVFSLSRYGSVQQYCFFVLAIWLAIFVFVAFGIFLAVSVPGPSQFGVMFVCIGYFFGWTGFFRTITSMPLVLQYLTRINPCVYLLQLAWHVTFSYGPDEFECTEGVDSNYQACIDGQASVSNHDALVELGVKDSAGDCVIILVLMGTLCHVASFLVLKRSTNIWLKKKRMLPPADSLVSTHSHASAPSVALTADTHSSDVGGDDTISSGSVHDGSCLSSLKVCMHNLGVAASGKNILEGIDGIIEPGSMLCVMGPTGSGKTTLLSALASRIKAPAKVNSINSISYNGHSWNRSLKRLIGYVEQDDVVMAELTVRQSLTYAARLRLAGTDIEGKKVRVEEVINVLGLSKCADTKIGSAMVRGVSGGERKRVCIATELLAAPRLLICDEPSTGLDSETALNLVKALKKLAKADGITVVVSIHQPNSQVYGLFDRLLFLHKGHAVFNGEAQKDSLEHFEALGLRCPLHTNPPDW